MTLSVESATERMRRPSPTRIQTMRLFSSVTPARHHGSIGCAACRSSTNCTWGSLSTHRGRSTTRSLHGGSGCWSGSGSTSWPHAQL